MRPVVQEEERTAPTFILRVRRRTEIQVLHVREEMRPKVDNESAHDTSAQVNRSERQRIRTIEVLNSRHCAKIPYFNNNNNIRYKYRGFFFNTSG